MDNVSRAERPGEREGRYIDQEITMQPLRPPVALPPDDNDDGIGPAETEGTKQLRSGGLPEDIMLPQVNKRGEPHIQPQTFVASINRPLTEEELKAINLQWFDLSGDSKAAIGTTVRAPTPRQPAQPPQQGTPPHSGSTSEEQEGN